jgi:hypothetical protein
LVFFGIFPWNLLFSLPHFSSNVTFINVPANNQFFPRDSNDSASVLIDGYVHTPISQTITLTLYKNGVLIKRTVKPLQYTGEAALFSFYSPIHSELSNYSFRVMVDSSEVLQRENIVCGDAYLIAGQSNAEAPDLQGKARAKNKWIRTFGTTTLNPNVCSAETTWNIAQAYNLHATAAVGLIGLGIGTRLINLYNVPICFINGAVGSTKIELHQPNLADHIDINTIYGRMLYRVRKAGLVNNVKALIWYQGENNADTSSYSYLSQFSALYKNWKTDYISLKKIYVMQIRPGCVADYQGIVRESQRQLPSLFKDIDVMSSTGTDGHDGCHFYYDGYLKIAEWLTRLITRDFYHSTDTLFITPPNIVKAYFTNETRSTIAVKFDQPVFWPADTLGASMKDYFYIENLQSMVSSYGISKGQRTIYLHLSSPFSASFISYLPDGYYQGTTKFYQGPWIKNIRGIGALSFNKFPISEKIATDIPDIELPNEYSLVQNFPNPFNSSTTIKYTLEHPSKVVVQIFNLIGQSVTILDNGERTAGPHYLQWRPTISSGSYYCVLKTTPLTGPTDGTTQIIKLIYLK